jgi:hypothetical protein
MATTTIFTSANVGASRNESTTYATARAGSGTFTTPPANDVRLGQRLNSLVYYCWQIGLEFDLTSLAGATISDATLSIWLLADDSTQDFTVDARASDYGAAYSSADFIAGASLSGLTLLATRATSGIGATGAYKAFTDVAMVGFLVPGSVNRLILTADRQSAGSVPVGNEYITTYYDDTGGSTAPKLDITYTAGVSKIFAMGGFF